MKNKLWLGLILGCLVLIGATPAFFPSTSMRGLLVDQNNVPYSIGTAGAAGSFFPSNQARVLLVDENNQPYKASSAGSGTVTSIATSNGITGGTITTTGTISGVNAAADGATKGVSAFTAADFNATTGVISLDYTNGQKATGSLPGFLSAADWTTFNAKQASGNYVTALTGDVTANGPGSAAATLANTAVTPASYTNTNLTVDSKGRITAASNGTAATSGLTLVARNLLTGDAQSTTFSGLNGNTDGVYELQCHFINGASTSFYTWQPNGVSTNQASQRSYSDNQTVANTNLTTLQLAFGVTTVQSFARATIYARNNPNSVASTRHYVSQFTTFGTTVTTGTISGRWNETATNITSIVVTGDQTDSLKSGSECALYKYAQS